MNISIIAAVARNGAIGKQNKLIYRLPDDLKRFRQLTTGHTIVMGRRTYESLPKGALPNRRNVVVSRTLTGLPGCDCYSSVDQAIASCRPDEDVYIIGGESIYRATLPMASRLFLTEINDTPEGADAFFPEWDRNGWRQTAREDHPADERHAVSFSFADYERDGEK